MPLILSQLSKDSCCVDVVDLVLRDLEQQGYGCGPRGAHDHFP
jgi:hypothetical protein